ncbi:diacylglycerol kinase [Thermaerobacter marianensis DSM 12885]|uniref:Diacylglycerol kinase n=1 Tax=Thermaerobacter marianensis (strain ATCC 700841 / DSM 12885 / JCM 10246 / 7p75a) TaxID=644966 RepID=E6SK91_THEM7|nr:diacylglycerol kinase family protein [Thermaerobacter marianensis]ADU52249.1 diacylglycerol kinase [Thermaerobacter marianensis DSM 12885]
MSPGSAGGPGAGGDSPGSRRAPGDGRTGARRPGSGRAATLAESFRYAWAGFVWIWGTEANMRLHFAAATLLFTAAWWLEAATWQWAVLLLAAGLVVLFEWINTAIEGAVDLATDEFRPLAGRVKDVAAGAVLVAALLATVTGLLVLGPDVVRLPGLLVAYARGQPWRLLPLLAALYFAWSSLGVRRANADEPASRRPAGSSRWRP